MWTNFKLLQLWFYLVIVFTLNFSSICCCPFGHIQSDAENFAENSTKFCVRLNCTTSAHCTAVFQHSRCSFFTKQCICDYNTVLDFESQQCVPKNFHLIQADDDDEPQYSSSILQWLPRSSALLFLLCCLVIWAKLTVDYLQRKWDTSKNRKTFNGNQQVVSPQLKTVNLMISLAKNEKNKNILNSLHQPHSTVNSVENDFKPSPDTEKLIS